ncbi:MAG TPA: alpha/beta hydrolase [Blastocatellia bacterium]|nr:alpha/beta hydrolase [Blastocatellia bacterium]
MTRIIKSVELPNQVTLQYVEQGDPAGVPVILLHGVTDSWYSFEPVLPHLPESIHAFALTQRGHGDSSHPADGYRFPDFAGDVAGFMDALQIEAAVVVGHSMGSGVGKRFAIDYPERTLGLVLVGAFATFQTNQGVREFWDSVVSNLSDPVDPGIAREFQESTLARPVPPAFLETVIQESLKVPARVWRAVFGGFMRDDYSEDLEKIKAPTLIVWGDRDSFCPGGDQETLLAEISGSRLVVYEGAGHALHWEEPERFASDLSAFVKECAPSAGS